MEHKRLSRLEKFKTSTFDFDEYDTLELMMNPDGDSPQEHQVIKEKLIGLDGNPLSAVDLVRHVQQAQQMLQAKFDGLLEVCGAAPAYPLHYHCAPLCSGCVHPLLPSPPPTPPPWPESRRWGGIPHRRCGGAHLDAPGQWRGQAPSPCVQSSETGTVRGFRWHNFPRERKGR